MKINVYSLTIYNDENEIRFYLETEDNDIVAEAVLNPGNHINWGPISTAPKENTIKSGELFEQTEILTKIKQYTQCDDPISYIVRRTFEYCESVLINGYVGASVEVENLDFIVHAQSKTRTERTGNARPKVSSLKTRVWI